MGDLSSKFSLKLKASIDLMVDAYARILAEAQKAGDISESLDAKETAYFIVAGWHGAIIQMKLTKNLAPLETHRKFIFNNILKTWPTRRAQFFRTAPGATTRFKAQLFLTFDQIDRSNIIMWLAAKSAYRIPFLPFLNSIYQQDPQGAVISVITYVDMDQ